MSHAGKRWRPHALLIRWDDVQVGGVCVCMFGGDREEITPAEVGEAAVLGVIRCDC